MSINGAKIDACVTRNQARGLGYIRWREPGALIRGAKMDAYRKHTPPYRLAPLAPITNIHHRFGGLGYMRWRKPGASVRGAKIDA